MSTQTAKVTLCGPNGAINFTATCTDGQWNEVKSETGTLSLFDTSMLGKVVSQLNGYYTAGTGAVRVRNSVTNEVKCLEFLQMLKGSKTMFLKKPFVVQDKDIVEIYTTAVA